ncbi:carbonic anhydrase 13-like [Schistocerca gregaria]|uniref:carbonic anhydrase 13-like n=1 Tax=Schistocerca gregaria TaxID=7010 RepID=UPI00211E7F85|nr:carbonic anhydrase 13-like [Schistocerca gregaria]
MAPLRKILVVVVLICSGVWWGSDASKYEEKCPATWGYGVEQEREWGCRCDDGYSQSPIAIWTKDRRSQNSDFNDAYTADIPSLTGTFYDERNTPFLFNITNNNHTVKVQLIGGEKLYLEGGRLQDRYYLDHLSFTWGATDNEGSEHANSYLRYAMEAQWTLLTEEYKESPDHYSGGIMKIGRVMMLAEEDNPSLAPIVAALPSVRQPGQTASPEEPIIYNNLFSDAIDDYYTYNGSLTTPPCSEPVVWLVYFLQEGVSKSQLAEFRKLQTTNGPMVNNFRQVHKKMDRGLVFHPSCTHRPCNSSSGTGRQRDGGRRAATQSGRHGVSKSHGAARRSQH